MSGWTGMLRRAVEAVVLLVGLGLLSGAAHLDAHPFGVRVALGLMAIALLWPVRRRLSLEAWLTDGPRTPGRHLLSVGLLIAWFGLLIAVGEPLHADAMDVLVLPGLVVGFVGSYALADVISDYFTSPQFMMADPVGDDPPKPSDPEPA